LIVDVTQRLSNIPSKINNRSSTIINQTDIINQTALLPSSHGVPGRHALPNLLFHSREFASIRG